ncbi:MAG: GntR family transcriptional regulator [Clostridia bacterium]|nr:GntR family transcriptional regulator [Clostridia bacterium]
MLRYLEIKAKLRELVISLPPGARLPSRTILVKRLQTTRTTLDKAFADLEKEGVIISRKGSGTYAADPLAGTLPQAENWGVMVPSISESIYSGMIRGIERFTEARGINIVVCGSDKSKEQQSYNIFRLMNSVVCGFIIVPVVSTSIEETYNTYQHLISSRIPFVFCNRPVEGINVPAVVSNDFYGGYMATKHLIERGYRHIAYIARHRHSTSINRYQGYASALQENGLTPDSALVMMEGGQNDEELYLSCHRLLSSDVPVDAIFCFNDYTALVVYRCIRDLGKRVSEDIGVIGYDSIEEGRLVEPQLTSVNYKSHEIGYKAAELLWSMLHGEGEQPDFPYYLFQPVIIENGSCQGPSHGSDRKESG